MSVQPTGAPPTSARTQPQEQQAQAARQSTPAQQQRVDHDGDRDTRRAEQTERQRRAQQPVETGKGQVLDVIG